MKYRIYSLISVFALLIGLLGSALMVTPARAADLEIEVTNNNDSGTGSLREALNIITNNPGELNIITFTANFTITLNSKLPFIASPTIISGNGAANTIIQASTCNPITKPGNCTPVNYRIFENYSDLTLDSLTVRHGNINGSGLSAGAILNYGTLSLYDSVITSNASAGNGGGIFNAGTLNATNSTFSSNHNTLDGNGGAILNDNGTITTLMNCTFSNNVATGGTNGGLGGGIYNDLNANLSIIGSTFTGNSAQRGGGAIYRAGGGGVTVESSVFSINSTTGNGGGIRNDSVADLMVTNTEFSGNTASVDGGGIYSNGGTLTVTSSTFSANTATGSGGGIFDNGTTNLVNSTFVGNTANAGGGLHGSAAHVTNSTFVNNTASGGGIAGVATLRNTIVTDASGDACAGTITANSANLVSDGSCGAATISATINLDTTLQNNGGLTKNLALLAGSSAIDAGENAVCTAAVGTPDHGADQIDQRGMSRPQGAVCDIGAYEVDAAPLVLNVSANNADGPYKAGATISVTVIFNEIVLVTGTPLLTLETGATDQIATYSSGSETRALVFDYVVQIADVSNDLDYVDTASLDLNGGTIEDVTANAAVITLPTPGGVGSLANNKAIAIDNTAPTVANVSANTANGTYGSSSLIVVTVTFDEKVTVSGSPKLTLETGATDRIATYASGSGTVTLTFNYSVQAFDATSDLDYLSTTSLNLNGGVITDLAGNNAVLTLPAPGDTGSLSANKDIVIETIGPNVLSITRINTSPTAKVSVQFLVTFSEAVTGVATTDFTLIKSGITGSSITGVSGTGSTRTVTVNTGLGSGTLQLSIPSLASIADVPGNPLIGLPYNAGQIYTIDKTLTYTSTASQDGWILESTETSNLGAKVDTAAATFNLGDDALKKQYLGILSFATSSIPDNATITGVLLKIKPQTIVGGGSPVTTFQGFMVDIKTGFFGTFAALQTLDFQSAASKTLGPASPVLTSGSYSINLFNGQAYINKLTTNSGLTQIRLRFKLDDNNNAIANYLSLHSGNAVNAADRPQLVITYNIP